MLKYRIIYICMLAVSVILLFLTGHFFALILCIGLLLFFILFLLLLRRDVRQIEVGCECSETCRVGQNRKLRIHVAARKWLLVAGFLQIRLTYINHMFGQERGQEIMIPLKGNRKELNKEYESIFQLCGREQIQFERIDCYDILGLWHWTVKLPKEQSIMIYPGQLDIQMNSQNSIQGVLNEEQSSSDRKGNDTTEIFELKKYQPGDDVRQIHWKLSEKMDELLIKEGSDPAHNSLGILFDVGRQQGNQSVDNQLLLTAVELGAAVSEALTEEGIAYDMLLAGNEAIYRTVVHNRKDYVQMLDQWLGREIADRSNSGMKYFLAQHYEQEYARLVYITVEELPEELELSARDMDITALVLKKDGQEIRAIKEKNYQILELAYAYIQEHTCQINI